MADIDGLLLAAEEQEAFSTHLEGWEIVESYSHSELYKDDHGPVLIENKTIGSLSEQITIEGESISQYIEFETNRFQDGVDLSNTAIMIHFERGESALDTKPINFYRSEDTIRFGWVVPASVAAETTDIRLCVWSTWEVDGIPYVWKTRPATYSIQDGLMLGANIEEPDEEWYTSFIRVLDEKVTSAANSAVEARTSEENAKSSEIEAKKSESNAQEMAAGASESAQAASTKASEAAQSAEAASNSADLAEEYRNQAFSTTPEGYEEVVNTVEKNRIKVDTILEKSNLMFDNSASGESIHLTDSTDNKAVEFALLGKATQKQYSGKNLIPYPYYESNHTDNGITWTNNGDGRLTANGTATGNSDYFMVSYNAMITLKAGTYIVNGCPNGGGESTHSIIVGKKVNGTLTRIALANENGTTLTLTEDTDIYVTCRVSTGKTVSNLIFEPMISKEGGEFEPYVGGIPSPNPEFPHGIDVPGVGGSIEVTSLGKNFIDSNVAYGFIRSIGTYENGTINLSKTESGRSYYFADYKNLEMGKTYTVSAKCNTEDSKGGLIYAMLYVRKEDGSTAYEMLHSVYGTDIVYTFTVSKQVEKVRINFCLGNDSAANGTRITISEMQLEPGDTATEYEPYKESVTNIATPNGLPGIEVSSGGNYIDESGQQWVTDEIVKYADGTGKKIQRIGKKVFDGSDDEGWETASTSTSGVYRIRTKTAITDTVKKPISNSEKANILCTAFVNVTSGATYSQDITGISVESTGHIYLRTNEYATNDISLWKAYLASNPMTVYYELAEPIITDLSAEEIAEMEVQTFYPTTNILNDAGCGMEVTYKADTKNYIDKIIGNRLSALETALINNI